MAASMADLIKLTPTPRTDKAMWHTKDGVRVVDYEVAVAMEKLLGHCLWLLKQTSETLSLELEHNAGVELKENIDKTLELVTAQQV